MVNFLSEHRTALLLAAIISLSAGGCSGPYLKLGDDLLIELSSPDPNIVALAALAVSESSDKRVKEAALPLLCKLLDHRDPLVRAAAGEALERITGVPSDYEPYRDPAAQEASIEKLNALVSRSLEAPHE